MDMNEFQQATLETAVYPNKGERTMDSFNYCVVGLCGEAGELANKWKKVLRGDGNVDKELALDLGKEIMDTVWYCARALDELGLSMDDEAQVLLNRLRDRKERGVVKGSGDNR